MEATEKKIRHTWINNGVVKHNKKCTRCGVEKRKDGRLEFFYVNGSWVNENPNCVDNSNFV